jgi:hypothetical protein
MMRKSNLKPINMRLGVSQQNNFDYSVIRKPQKNNFVRNSGGAWEIEASSVETPTCGFGFFQHIKNSYILEL